MPSDVLITPASSKIEFTDGANATKTLKITGTSLNTDTSFVIGGTTANNTLSVLGSASIGSGYNVAGPTNGLIVQGNVGIGTTNPSQALDVRGNIKLGADNSGNYVYYVKDTEGTIINTSRSDSTQQGLFRSDGWGNFTADKSIGVGYSLGSSFPSSTIGNGNLYAAGKVGVGTTNPSAKLSTGPSSGMKLLVYDNPSTGVYTGLGQDLAAGNSTDLFAHSVSNLGFITFGKIGTNGSTYTEWARFNTSGNLGIGTTTVSYKLHVQGDIYARSAVINISGDLNALRGNVTTMGYNLTNSPSGAGWITVNTSQNFLSSGDILSQLAYDNYNQQKLFTRHSSNYGATWSAWKTIINSDAVSGTTNYIAKFTGTNSIGNSLIFDNGTNVAVGSNAVAYGRLQISATGTSPSLSSTNPTDVSLIISNSDIAYGAMFATYGDGKGALQQRRTNAATYYDFSLQPHGGNVGIGTLSPLAKLHVAGTTGLYQSANSTYLYYDHSGVNTWRTGIFTDNTSSYIIGHDTGGTFATKILTITMGGNVSIGTTSPSAKLHLNSTTSGATLLRADGTNGTLFSVIDDLSDSLMSVNNSAGLPVLEVFADDRVVMGQYGANDFVLRNNRVGIGTSNPTNELHVYASAAGSTVASNAIAVFEQSSNAGIQVCVPDASEAGLFFSRSGAAYYSAITRNGTDLLLKNNSATAVTINSSGNVGVNTANPTTKLYVTGSVTALDGSFISNVTFGTDRYFLNCYGTSTNQMFSLYENSSNIYLNSYSTMALRANQNGGSGGFITLTGGNVGVGGNPSARLHVIDNNASPATGNLLVSSTGGNASIRIDSNSTSNFTYFTLSQGGSGKFELGIVPTTSDLYINPNVQTGATNAAIYIKKADGNVGINTTTPAYKLDVNGTFNATGTSTLAAVSITGTITTSATEAMRVNNNNGYISIYNSAGSTRTGYIQGLTGSSLTLSAENGAILQFLVAGSERARIGTSGNVGIGTTNTGYSLNLYAASAPQFALSNATRSFVLTNNAGDGLLSFYYDAANRLQFNTTNQWFNTGNLGIGTTVPSARLQVGTNSTAVSADNSPIARFGGSGSGSRVYGLTLANTASAAISNDSSLSFIVAGNYSATGIISAVLRSTVTAATDLVFTNYNNALFERMRIQFDGNIGIGTSLPAALLQINSGTPTSATGGIQFGDDTGTRLYRSSSGVITCSGTIAATFSGALTGNVTGNVSGSSGSCTGNTSGSSTFVAGLGVLNYDNDRTTKRAGLSHYTGYSTGTNRPTTYDYTLQVTNGTSGWEISMDWIAATGPAIYARSLRDCCQNWSSWVRILDSANYSYAANMNQNVRITDNVAFGIVTATFSGNLTGNATNVTGVVALANGGSGQTSAQAAMNAFAGAVTSGSYLRGNGTNVVMSTIQASDVPTLNQNTTGSSGSCTGNAATATNASQLGGAVAARYVRNDTDGTAGDLFSLVTVTKSLTVTTSWIDTGISAGSDLVSGAYILTLNVDNYAVSGGHYNETYTGIMYWYAGATNSTNYDEIPLHKSGHAPNGIYINLRTLRGVSGVLKLQIISSVATSGASNYIFKFRRMI
jgi:hypothetical protein